jgi:hypothetical protein
VTFEPVDWPDEYEAAADRPRPKRRARRTQYPGLWSMAAIAGSLAVLASGLATVWLPWPWDAGAWAVLAVALCAYAGRWIGDRYADAEEHAERCRPVTVEVDGEQITVSVLAEEPMSEEGRAAFAEIVAAAKRKLDAQPPRDDLRPGCGFPVGTAAHRRSRKHAGERNESS